MLRIILLLLFANVTFAQNVRIKLGTTTPWPKDAIVSVPSDLTKKYPLIFFVGGTAEATDANRLAVYGPSALIAKGTKIDAVVVSLAPGLYPPASFIDAVLEEIFVKYPVDESKVILTGLSMGSWVMNSYISVPAYAKKISAVYSLQAVQVPAKPLADSYNGKWWGVEGGSPDEQRGGNLIASAINAQRPGFAELTVIPSGKAGYTHCCWETMYDLSFKNKAGQSWLEWALGTKVIEPPVEVPPTRVIAGRVFLAGWEFILYTDGYSESKK